MRDRATRENRPEEAVETAVAAEPQQKPSEHFSTAGQVPPVADATAKSQQTSASDMAFEKDDHVRELKAKVGALVASKFGNDYKQAFAHYDADHDGAISKDELSQLLHDAGVGNGITRGAWVNGIIDKLDSSHDGKIEWGEFETVVR